MWRKSSLLTCVVLVLGLACSASGSQWTDAGDGNSWCNPDNWQDPPSVPTSTDTAYIRPYWGAEDGPTIDCDVDVGGIEGPYGGMDVNITTNGTVNIVSEWNWEDVASGTSNVFITGSPTISIGGHWWIAESQGSKCILNITGNPTITVGTDMPTAGPGRLSCYFTMNMSNGSLDVAGRFAWESGGGALNISGGTIECDTLVYGGEGGKPWTLNLSGGRITVIDEFKVADQEQGDANAFMNLDAGTLECGSFAHDGRRYAMDINEGVFIIDGNVVPAMNEDVNLGYITAFDGTVDVLVTYDEGSNKTTVRADYLQPEASDPSPADYAQNQCPGLELSWTPGPYAVDHNVYFGTSLSDVNGSKDPCLVRYDDANWVPPDLELGKTYYWRVDEVNDACDASPWVGDIWHFTTEDGNARNPDPPSSKRYHNPSENILTWTPSCVATSQNVYLSTDFNDVNELQGTYYALGAADNNIAPTLEKAATYYWRVKTIGGGDGKIWNFTTGFGVIMHYKFDGSEGAALPSLVTDDSGNDIEFTKYVGGSGSIKYGESNPVYNSEEGASAEFDPCSGLYRPDTGGNDPLRLAGPRYTIEMWLRPEVLDSDDDIRLIGKNNSWRIIIEDPGGDNRYAWVHGGNTEDMGDNTAVEGEWAHLGFVYNYFDPDNDRMNMYLDGVLLNDNDEDNLNPSDNNNPVAIGFRVPLDGNVANGTQYFEGLIDELRILDVALAPAKFLLTPGPQWASNPRPGNRTPDVDPNDPDLALIWDPGTKVAQHRVYFSTNLTDVCEGNPAALMDTLPAESNSWPTDGNLGDYLLYGTWHYWRIDEVNGTTVWEGVVWKFVTKYEIKDPHLKVWYPLDEDSGDDAYDTSGHVKHGDVDIDDDLPFPNWEPEGGRFSGCLVFDNDTAIEPPEDTLPSLEDGGITVALWLNGLTTQDPEKNMWVLDGGTDDYRLTVIVPDIEAKVIWRAGNDSNDYLEWEVDTSSWQGDWHHLAFVKDETAEKMYIYLDGDLGWWKPGADPTITNLANEQLRIGARETSSNNYQGKMDDFRIYDIALSETDIDKLVRGGDLADAWGPSPYDGQADAPRDANLVWNAGDYADSHDVYFGTDYAAVRDANTSVTLGVFRGHQSATTYDLDTLTLDTWYFWRIDEVNDSNDATWTGRVWKFKVADYVVLDDFESYESTSHLRQNWDIWAGEYGEFLTGARPYLANYSVLYPPHGGDQIMRYGYSTDKANPPPEGWMDVDYAEAYLSFTGIRRDWTDAGVRALTLYFYGLPANTATEKEQMYVGVEDTNGTYAEIRYGDYERVAEEDINDLNEPEWHRWFIALPDFNDSNWAAVPNDVDLANVDRLYIGFGNRRSPQAGGSGEVRFDDIRTNLPICRPDLAKPVGDFTGPRGVPDCVVDLVDIGYIADEWLKSDANFADIMQEPCDANLLGHWKLDGDPCDSSSYNHYGFIDTEDSNYYSWVTGHDGEVTNPAIEFTDTCRLLVPDDNNTPALRPKYQVSVSAWVYSKGQSDSARVVVKGQDNKETYGLEVSDQDNFTFNVRDANGQRYGASTDVSQDEWLHLAGTYDGNTVKCYVNAELRETTDANFVVVKGWTLSQDKSGLAIGNRSDATDKQFNGIIDDVRVYDYALSAGEVAWLATDGTGSVPLRSQANLYDEEPEGEKAVNFRDIAKLIAEYWLDEVKWP